MSPLSSPLSFVTWLNDTPWSIALRENDNPFPVIESVHVLALGVSVGTILWVDLRLMGVGFKRVRALDVIQQLEPWAIGGFIVMFASGLLLFFAEPLKAYTTLAFRIKMVLVALAGLNVWLFNNGIFRRIEQWDEATSVPWQAKMTGWLSLVLWLGIIVCGRWTAYF
jgi:hypothetical protein